MSTANVRIEFEGLDFRQDVEPLIKEFYPGSVSDTDVSLFFLTGEDSMTVIHTAVCDAEPDTAEIYERGNIYESQNAQRPEVISECDENGVFRTVIRVSEAFVSENEGKLRHRDYRNLLLRTLYRVLHVATDKELPWGVLTGVRPTKLVFERIERGEAGHLKFMADKYLVSEEKAALATRIAAVEYRLLGSMDYRNGYSLYVGMPFCPSICNYCSFGSHPIDRFADCVEPYLEALRKEIRYASTCFPGKKLETVYFGGGTPTSVSAEQLRSLITCVKDNFDMTHVCEFTVEAGRPDSITSDKLDMLKEENVTRISINPQSMVQRTLDAIGRKHTALQIIEAFNMAREKGFDNINMDLIAGLTGENIDDFRYTLNEMEKLCPDSITVHTLAHKRAAKLTTESELYEGMEATDVKLMVDTAANFMKQHGYEPYYMYRQKNMTDNLENVGYAKKGREGLYNILIMEEKQMILACGSGASSKFVRDNGDKRFERVENVKNVHEYIARIDEMIERKRNYIAANNIT